MVKSHGKVKENESSDKDVDKHKTKGLERTHNVHKRNIVYFGKKGCSQEDEVLKTLLRDNKEGKPRNQSHNNAIRIDQDAFLSYIKIKYPQLLDINATTPSIEVLERLKLAIVANSSILMRKGQVPAPCKQEDLKIILKSQNLSKIIMKNFTRKRNKRNLDIKTAENQKENGWKIDKQKPTTGGNDFHNFINKVKQIKAKETAAPFDNFLNQFKAIKHDEHVDKTQNENYKKFVNNLKDMKHEEKKEKEGDMVTRMDKPSDEHVLADVRYNLEKAFDIKERRENTKPETPDDLLLRNLKRRSLNRQVVNYKLYKGKQIMILS